jgi:cytoskeleton protein RodZ
MESLAAHLKSEREKRRITLEQIARETRISLRHLESLEEGRYGELPGGMYNRAFLRTYCEFVRIDPVESLARFEAESPPLKEKTTKAKSAIPQVGSALRPHPLLVWSVMLLISVTGLYFSRRWIAAVFSPYFSHPAAPMLAAASATSSSPSYPAKPRALTTPVPLPGPEVVGAQAVDPPSSVLAAGVASSAPAPLGTIRLEFEVLQECWVSLNRDGSRVLVKVLEPGDDQSFSASEQFLLVLGNAGGVRLKINGKLVRPLGKRGEVVRVLINEQNIGDLLEKSTG